MAQLSIVAKQTTTCRYSRAARFQTHTAKTPWNVQLCKVREGVDDDGGSSRQIISQHRRYSRTRKSCSFSIAYHLPARHRERQKERKRESSLELPHSEPPISSPQMLHTTSQHSFPSLQLERLQCSYAQKDVKQKLKQKKNRKELKLNPKIYRQLHVVYSAQCSDV